MSSSAQKKQGTRTKRAGPHQIRYDPESKHKVTRKISPPTDDYISAFNLMKIARALLARMLFVIHSLITIWQAVEVYEKQAYWSFSLITIAILIEGAVTLLQRGGDESRWFCPCVFLYILSTVPSIWFLELDLSRKRLERYSGNTTRIHISYTQVESTLHISHELSVQIVEQFLLVVLIVGRWLLPKGVITREQLSQILLAYLAIASDIVELFDVFKEPAVVRHMHLRYTVLATWSLSLLQFPFVLTTSKARKMRIAITQSSSDEELKRIQSRIVAAQGGQSTFEQILHDADIWAIFLANFLQDVPFLVVRLYLMVGYKVVTYTMIFFTCKNVLIIALQTYRLFILVHDRYQQATPEDDARRLARHYRHMLTHCKEALTALKQAHPHVAAHPRGGGGGGGAGGAPSGGETEERRSTILEASGSHQSLHSPLDPSGQDAETVGGSSSHHSLGSGTGGTPTKRRHKKYHRTREDSIQEVEGETESGGRNRKNHSPSTSPNPNKRTRARQNGNGQEADKRRHQKKGITHKLDEQFVKHQVSERATTCT